MWYWSFGCWCWHIVAGTDDVSSFVMLVVEGMVNQVCAVRGPSKEDIGQHGCVLSREFADSQTDS